MFLKKKSINQSNQSQWYFDGASANRGCSHITTKLKQSINPGDQGLHMSLLFGLKKMQSCSAGEPGISQPPVGRIIHETINAHFRPHIVQQFIKFPLDDQQLGRRRREKRQISHRHDFPLNITSFEPLKQNHAAIQGNQMT